MKKVGVSFRYPEKLPPYENAVRVTGLEPVAITPDEPRTLDGLDGLLLSGGTDVNPELFGEARGPHTEQPDSPRDELELRLLAEALDKDLPVLAICRGMQLFNIYHGGTLQQHLENAQRHSARSKPAHEEVHFVRICPKTRAARIFGVGDYGVNSRHHQGIHHPGSGVVVSGLSDDALVEVIERADKRFAVAVQWHPEDRVNHSSGDRRLFEAFAEAVRG
jgi:putative glutamine amidotransferase